MLQDAQGREPAMLTDDALTPGTGREVAGLEALRELQGSELGTSGWLTVDQSMIDAFADATGDHQWIHTDPTRAAQGPFGGTVAHGYFTVSVLPMLVKSAYRVNGLSMAVNYGSDRVRFPSPVRVGSRVRAQVTLVEVTPRGDAYLSRTRVTVEVEGSERPACTAELLSLLVP